MQLSQFALTKQVAVDLMVAQLCSCAEIWANKSNYKFECYHCKIDEFFQNKSSNFNEFSKKRSKTSSDSYVNDKSLWGEFVFGTSKELISSMRRSSTSEEFHGKNPTISRLERLSTKRTHVRSKQTISRRPSIGSEYNRIIKLWKKSWFHFWSFQNFPIQK